VRHAGPPPPPLRRRGEAKVPSSLSTGTLSVGPAASLGVIRFRSCPLQQVSCYTLPSGCQPSWPPTCYHQQTTSFVVSEDELAIGHRNPGSRSIPHRQYSLPVIAHREPDRNSQHHGREEVAPSTGVPKAPQGPRTSAHSSLATRCKAARAARPRSWGVARHAGAAGVTSGGPTRTPGAPPEGGAPDARSSPPTHAILSVGSLMIG
jgi:hypothetical protein